MPQPPTAVVFRRGAQLFGTSWMIAAAITAQPLVLHPPAPHQQQLSVSSHHHHAITAHGLGLTPALMAPSARTRGSQLGVSSHHQHAITAHDLGLTPALMAPSARTRGSQQYAKSPVVLDQARVAAVAHHRPSVRYEPPPRYLSADPKSGFTPLFDRQPVFRTASTNAGSTNLVVGGGGINGAFASELGTAVAEAASKHHVQLWNDASTQRGKSYYIDTADSPVTFSLGRACPGTPNTIGFAAVDLIRPRYRSDLNNAAMAYVVGPDGRSMGPDDFLRYLKLSAGNLVYAVADFNLLCPGERIQALRIPLISGSIYKHAEVTTEAVAEAILRGTSEAMAAIPQDQRFHLQFHYDNDVFRKVETQIKRTNTVLNHNGRYIGR